MSKYAYVEASHECKLQEMTNLQKVDAHIHVKLKIDCLYFILV